MKGVTPIQLRFDKSDDIKTIGNYCIIVLMLKEAGYMRIISERAKVTTVGPGVEAVDVEIVVEEIDKGFQEYYANLHACDGIVYSITEKGIYDYVTGLQPDDGEEIKFLEEYQSLDEAKKSKYYKIFEIADSMADDFGITF